VLESAGSELATLPDGKFLVLGEIRSWSSWLWRYNADATPDTSFGQNGRIHVPVGFDFPGFGALFVQPDGKILLPWNQNPDFGDPPDHLSRLKPDGSVDTSFGDSGTITLPTLARDISIDGQGRIVGVGDGLFRLASDGTPDPSFDDDGIVASEIYQRGALDASGRVVVANADGVSRFGPGSPVQLAPNGLLRIDGDDGADTVTAAVAGETLTVTFNGQLSTFSAAAVKSIFANLFAGNDVVDLSVDVDMTVDAGNGNDSIRTGGGADFIQGDDGNDTVNAGDGNDVILGGPHGDSLFGEGGADVIFGDFGSDSISGGDGNDKLFGGSDGPTNFPDDNVMQTDDDSLSGNAGSDRCYGMDGNDRVAGNGGRDRLFGGAGDDRILGGASGDWLYGDVGNDKLNGEGGNDRLYADDDEASAPHSGVDTLHGNAGDDELVSRDSAADQLFGDGGRDSCFADEGIDVLTSVTPEG
jgi:uncharacterized delta-60 repeat protein